MVTMKMSAATVVKGAPPVSASRVLVNHRDTNLWIEYTE